MRLAISLVAVALACPASAGAATIHGLVYDDANRDGLPTAGEPGVANVIVAFGTEGFIATDSRGAFAIDVPDDARGIVWARVPEGFTPGPVWGRWDGKADVELGLRRLHDPVRGPLTFVVAADTHIGIGAPEVEAADLARAAHLATTLEPEPAFFTILGDITQGSRPDQYAIVDKALAGLRVPWIPVPGNHDWYDSGAAWFERYGPDNYSFDIGGVHFVVWNMALPPETLRAYLGAELKNVPATMPIVALTHDPPHDDAIDVLRELGVDYVLTGHTHSNRVVDHGFIELNTEPFLMGGLDFTPAGYRVVTIDGARLSSYHRTVVDKPFFALVSPTEDDCVRPQRGELLVAAEVAVGANKVSASIDCGTGFELRPAGGWLWRGELPALPVGDHVLSVSVYSRGGGAGMTKTLHVCAGSPPPAPPPGRDWTQVGGAPDHAGGVTAAISPPLGTRWVAALGNHVLTSAPIIAGGTVYVATTDLADGDTGGVIALELATGEVRWRVRTPKPIRGGVAFAAGTVVTTQIDGNVLALDAATGAVRWRRAMSEKLPPQAGAVFSPPAATATSVFLGHQRAAAALDLARGDVRWMNDPVPDGLTSQSAAAIAVGSGLAVGTFNRELGGVVAWDAETGALRWRLEGENVVAINAAPVIGGDSVYVVAGTTEVIALDLAGKKRWSTKLDTEGFDWGHASVGTPALAGDTLIVPTLYGSVVALDTRTGTERWRYRAHAGPLRSTHYRGKDIPAFAASPVVTGDLVWTADTSGLLSALDVHTGTVRWKTALPSPVMAGLAVSGDWLVVASYDGTVRAMTPGLAAPALPRTPATCTPPPVEEGCGCSGGAPATGGALALVVAGVLVRRRRPSA